jgi:hypothetical protein
LKENPANMVALQCKYCLAHAQGKEPDETIDALNEYLGQQMMDVSGWHKKAQL